MTFAQSISVNPLYIHAHCTWSTLCLFVRYGTFRAAHLWYPSSAKMFRTVLSLILGNIAFAISRKGFLQLVTAVRTRSRLVWSETSFGQPERRKFCEFLLVSYLFQMRCAEDFLIPNILPASRTDFPALTAPMNRFFVGVSYWVQEVSFSFMYWMKTKMGWVYRLKYFQPTINFVTRQLMCPITFCDHEYLSCGEFRIPTSWPNKSHCQFPQLQGSRQWVSDVQEQQVGSQVYPCFWALVGATCTVSDASWHL